MISNGAPVHSRRMIRWLVRAVARRFPWYKQLLDSSDFGKTGNFHDLPILDAIDLNSSYYPQASPTSTDLVYHTSGTTSGSPRLVIWTAADHRRYVAQRTHAIESWLCGFRGLACVDLGTGHAAASGEEILQSIGCDTFSISFRAPIDQHIQLLAERRPAILFSMPMILDRLRAYGGIPSSVKRLIVLGDIATREWKNRLCSELGLERSSLVDLYGSIEVGAIAYECHGCDLFHFHDHVIPESLPTTRSSVALASEELLVTSFARLGLPCVRLSTGDRVDGLFRHHCQRASRSMWSTRAVAGRSSWIVKHGEWLDCGRLAEALRRFLPGAPFEILKHEYSLSIRIVAPSYLQDEIRTELRRVLQEATPSVAAMIDAGLVADLEIEMVSSLAGQDAKIVVRHTSEPK